MNLPTKSAALALSLTAKLPSEAMLLTELPPLR